MSKYQVGDRVSCHYFPHQDDPNQFTKRPGIILKVIQVNGKDFYKTVKLTTTDKTGKYPGIWVPKDSANGKAMKLKDDSFIDLQYVAQIEELAIERFYGKCNCMKEIFEICNKHGTPI